MSGIDLVWPDAAPDHPSKIKLEEMAKAHGLLPPYVADGALPAHLLNATVFMTLKLSVMKHTNSRRQAVFESLSYYADDPWVRAYCTVCEGVYLAILGAPFTRRLVKICHRMAPALELRQSRYTSERRLQRDEELDLLLKGKLDVSEAEAETIVSSWPSAETQGGELELGEYALFYDLIRLVWIHEWAHALCGHLDLAVQRLGIAQLHEFSNERPGLDVLSGLQYPRSHILQAIEMHADEFAGRFCLEEILWGYDPIGQMAGPTVDLVDRLLIFNVACSIFAVVWALAEQEFSPDDTFMPKRLPLTSNEPDPMFKPLRSTHPPAVLRYMRFRDLVGNLAYRYKATLSVQADARSGLFLHTLTGLNGYFHSLGYTSPPISSPLLKRLQAYEAYLAQIQASIAPLLTDLGYPPTVDPWATDPEEVDG